MEVLCFALFALSFNLLLGFGLASYAGLLGAKAWGVGPALAILAGTALAALLGLLFGAPAIRRRGISFAMITLPLAQTVYIFCLRLRFAGGEDGIRSVPPGELFGAVDLANDRTLYVVVALAFPAAMLLVHCIVHPSVSQALKAIRDNEPRAVSLGHRADRYKLVVFVLSPALAGFAGAIEALVFQLASLTDVHWSMSGEVVVMTLVGGMGTVFGADITTGLENDFAQIGAWMTIVQGVVSIACVLVFRGVVAGLFTARRKSVA